MRKEKESIRVALLGFTQSGLGEGLASEWELKPRTVEKGYKM